jgi:isopenicillin-N epimerase
LAAKEPHTNAGTTAFPTQSLSSAPPELPADLAQLWDLADGVTYLNHGSFGLTPRHVLEKQTQLRGELTGDPVDFLCRRYQPYLNAALARLAAFVGTSPANLVFVDNATTGMNAAAVSLPLSAGDEVIVGDHEYGAVARLWRHVAQRSGANVHTPVIAVPLNSADALVDALLQPLNSRTRVLVVSHVTSATAVVFPLEQIVAEARRRHAKLGGAPLWIVVDGPHALVQVPLRIDQLDVDCYVASCHKWLSAPLGSGFLYANPRVQSHIRPALTSWGTMPADEQENFQGEFHWPGTRDPSAWLAVPAAIALFESIGLERFRNQTHELARYARGQLIDRLGAEPLTPDSPDWYASMVALALPEPAGEAPSTQAAKRRAISWQQQLWERAGIEVPLNVWGGRTVLRVSCHLYNRADQIDRLVATLAEVLKSHK